MASFQDITRLCKDTMRYYERVINRRSIIVFLRKKKNIPYITIEYDYETFELLQARMKFNDSVDENMKNYIIDLGKQLYCEMLTLH